MQLLRTRLRHDKRRTICLPRRRLRRLRQWLLSRSHLTLLVCHCASHAQLHPGHLHPHSQLPACAARTEAAPAAWQALSEPTHATLKSLSGQDRQRTTCCPGGGGIGHISGISTHILHCKHRQRHALAKGRTHGAEQCPPGPQRAPLLSLYLALAALAPACRAAAPAAWPKLSEPRTCSSEHL